MNGWLMLYYNVCVMCFVINLVLVEIERSGFGMYNIVRLKIFNVYIILIKYCIGVEYFWFYNVVYVKIIFFCFC